MQVKTSLVQNLTCIQINTKETTVPDLIKLPLGIKYSSREHKLMIDKGISSKILLKRKDYPPTQIWPYYHAMVHAKNGKLITFRLLYSPEDLAKAMRIISDEHYLLPYRRGMHLVAAYSNEPDNFIGCLTLHTLTHGVPSGRKYFADLQDPLWKSLPRNVQVQRLKLAWIARIATVQEQQSNGIGTALAFQALEIARLFRDPPAGRVEVIQTLHQPDAERVNDGPLKSGFLGHAGYLRSPELYRSTKLRGMPAKKLYYYSKWLL